jgi:predicted acetyltransferase
MPDATIRRTPAPLGHRFSRPGTQIGLFIGDQEASGLGVVELALRVSDIVLRCGGIAGVHTARDYRESGYARQVLEDSLAFMREEGYHLSALLGIPNFYHKLGYAAAFVDAKSVVATINAEAALPRYSWREHTPADLPAIASLYTAMTAQRTGALVRDPATWPGFRWGANWADRVGGLVLVDGEQVVGYLSYNLSAADCSFGEVGYRDETVFSTLLAAATQLGLARRKESLTFYAPPDDRFLAYCRRYGCETTILYRRHAGGMARIINQSALLDVVQQLLAQRLRDAALPWAGTLLLRTDLGEEALRFGPGATLRAAMPQELLAQLLLGYRSVADALFESEAQVEEAALPVLEALFPQGYPYLWSADMF